MATKQTDTSPDKPKTFSPSKEQTQPTPEKGVSGSKKTNTPTKSRPMETKLVEETGSGSRVQFDATAGKENVHRASSGPGRGGGDGHVAKRKKRSFRDIVIQEVLANMAQENQQLAGHPPKGILKVRSEPVLSHGDEDPEKQSLSFVNQAYEGDSGTAAPDNDKLKVKKAFSRAAAAAGNQGSSGFADVVGLLIQRTSLDMGGRDTHPYGRDCSIEGILQASRPKSHSKNSAFSKLVVWMTMMCILMGMACGVIFLS
ncbi:hypothetical protein BaRGS_00038886, partial [Batillaria attramentaria]